MPLIVYTLDRKTGYVLELLDIEKSKLNRELLQAIQSLEIPAEMSRAEEKIRFLQLLVPGWLKSGTRFDSLKLNNINGLDDPTVFKVPTSYEKGTDLLGKKLSTVMKILIRLILPASLEKLMTFMNYKNKKSFRELYLHPLMQNELIKRTIPDNINDPKQEYIITRKGRLFLGGFPTT